MTRTHIFFIANLHAIQIMRHGIFVVGAKKLFKKGIFFQSNDDEILNKYEEIKIFLELHSEKQPVKNVLPVSGH